MFLKNKEAQAWVSCCILSLFFFFIIFQMSVFSTINSFISDAYAITNTQLGYLSSTYFYVAAVSLLPAGVMLDIYPLKKQVAIIMGVCLLFTGLFAIEPKLPEAYLYRGLSGLGNTFAFLACMKFASNTFSHKRIALAMSVMVTIGMLGGATQPLFSLLIEHIGWQTAIKVNTLVGLCFWILILFFLKETKEKESASTPTLKASPSEILAGIKEVLLKKQNLLCSIYTSLLNLPVVLLGALWGTLFLEHTQTLDKLQASIVMSMVFFGLIIGSPVFGWFSDAYQTRRHPMIAGAIGSILIVTVIALINNIPFITLALLFLGLGFFSSGQVISYPVLTESNPLKLTGITMSVVSIFIYLTGALSQLFFGWLTDTLPSHTIFMDMSLNQYNLSMLLLVLAFTISLFCTLFIVDPLKAN